MQDDVYESDGYGKMWYKNGNNFGIRIKGGRQICSVGGMNSGLSKEEMAALANKVMKRLDQKEMTESAAKEWISVQIKERVKTSSES